MPKERDSSAALRSRTESSTDEIKKKNVSPCGDDQTWARLALQQEKQVERNPPLEDRPRNSRGYAAVALKQSRWRNNSGPGLESEDPCSPLPLRVKVQPTNSTPSRNPQRGLKPSHRWILADTLREQLRVTFTCCNQRLKSEQLQTQKEHSLIDFIIIISDPHRGCYMGLHAFIFFSLHDLVRAIYLEPLLAETPNLVCCLVLRSNCALLLTIQFALLFFFFRHDFVRAISLEPLLAETPN